MKQEKEIKRGDIDFQYLDTVTCHKYQDKKVVPLVARNIDGMVVAPQFNAK